MIFNNIFLKLTLFVDKPTKRIKKNSENVNNKKYARNNLEKFFASNEMRERAFESKVHEKRHRQSKQENTRKWKKHGV